MVGVCRFLLTSHGKHCTMPAMNKTLAAFLSLFFGAILAVSVFASVLVMLAVFIH